MEIRTPEYFWGFGKNKTIKTFLLAEIYTNIEYNQTLEYITNAIVVKNALNDRTLLKRLLNIQ